MKASANNAEALVFFGLVHHAAGVLFCEKLWCDDGCCCDAAFRAFVDVVFDVVFVEEGFDDFGVDALAEFERCCANVHSVDESVFAYYRSSVNADWCRGIELDSHEFAVCADESCDHAERWESWGGFVAFLCPFDCVFGFVVCEVFEFRVWVADSAEELAGFHDVG